MSGLTKRSLIEHGVDALDPEKLATAAVRHQAASGVSSVNLPQVVEVAKFMAASGQGVPEHCRGNVGICLRVTFQAVEWGMSPFSVADMSYLVKQKGGGTQLSYMSQLLHAVIESRAPLQHRLDCEYDGEIVYDKVERTDEETGETFTLDVANLGKSTRSCTVTGRFISGDVRFYSSPAIKDVRVKNSPLWKDDPDQQLFYYASRMWARKWCPDVLLGSYTREELASQPLDQEDVDVAPGLRERLLAQRPAEEGHRDGFAARELAQIKGGGQTIEHQAAQKRPQAKAKPKVGTKPAGKAKKPAKTAAKGKPPKVVHDTADNPPRTETLINPSSLPSRDEVKAAADRAEARSPAQPPQRSAGVDKSEPRTVAQYEKYARAWIGLEESVVVLGQRWSDERAMRNRIGMTADDRAPLEEYVRARIRELENGDPALDDDGPEAA